MDQLHEELKQPVFPWELAYDLEYDNKLRSSLSDESRSNSSSQYVTCDSGLSSDKEKDEDSIDARFLAPPPRPEYSRNRNRSSKRRRVATYSEGAARAPKFGEGSISDQDRRSNPILNNSATSSECSEEENENFQSVENPSRRRVSERLLKKKLRIGLSKRFFLYF